MIRSIKKSEIRFALNNIEQQWLRRNDKTYSDFSKENPYAINLLHVNADQVPNVFSQLGERYFAGKYNIGYWFWELSDFPRKWFGAFDYFNEIWVASDFLLDAISKVSPVPVVKIPVSIDFTVKKNLTRASLGIEDDIFIFLNIFDAKSFPERKNPMALIDAFATAYNDFGCRRSLLILKMSNTEENPQLLDAIKEKTNGLTVIIINEYFDRDQIYDLISLSDCYVSLHRSEGFGLPLAEAMYLGKPVIATGYSGNMDFMNINNSYLVKYGLVEIEKDIGPYEKGSAWAEPDTAQAAELMYFVYSNRGDAAKTGDIASQDITKCLGPKTLGVILKKRLRRISRRGMAGCRSLDQ